MEVDTKAEEIQEEVEKEEEWEEEMKPKPESEGEKSFSSIRFRKDIFEETSVLQRIYLKR